MWQYANARAAGRDSNIYPFALRSTAAIQQAKALMVCLR